MSKVKIDETDFAPSGLGSVVGSSLYRRASPCAIDFALSGLRVCQQRRDRRGSKGK